MNTSVLVSLLLYFLIHFSANGQTANLLYPIVFSGSADENIRNLQQCPSVSSLMIESDDSYKIVRYKMAAFDSVTVIFYNNAIYDVGMFPSDSCTYQYYQLYYFKNKEFKVERLGRNFIGFRSKTQSITFMIEEDIFPPRKRPVINYRNLKNKLKM